MIFEINKTRIHFSSSIRRILFLEKIQINAVDKRTFTRKRSQRQNDLRYEITCKKEILLYIYIKTKVMVLRTGILIYKIKRN